MNLAANYRSLVRTHFPKARIVADRLHVIRIINHHFPNCWRGMDPVASKNRGLLSLMRRHRHNLRLSRKYPALELIYRFEQRLCYLLLNKHRTRRQCQSLIPRFLRALYQLRHAGLALQLGHTLASWSQEIVAMWRFTRKNGITEGLRLPQLRN